MLITGGVAAFGYLLYSRFKDSAISNVVSYVKENFSVQIAGVKIHKIGLSGLDLRISLDLINLTPAALTIRELKAFVFYVKNGTNNHLATTSIGSEFTIRARDTSRISDIKINVPYINLLTNSSILSAVKREFKVTVQANVNGTSVQFSNNVTV